MLMMAVTSTLLEDPAFMGSVFTMLILGVIVSVAAVIIYILMKARQ